MRPLINIITEPRSACIRLLATLKAQALSSVAAWAGLHCWYLSMGEPLNLPQPAAFLFLDHFVAMLVFALS